MSASHSKTVWFGCKKCHSFYPTLERGIQHLIHSPQHTSEVLDLVDRYRDDFRDAAARTLISFTIHTNDEHDAAITEAKIDALHHATGKRRILQPDSDTDSDTDSDAGPSKRGRLMNTDIDNSNRSQNVTNRSSVVNNFFMEPINVRITVQNPTAKPQRSTRSQDVDNRASLMINIPMEPIAVRVTVNPRATHLEAVFPFMFVRDKHTTVKKLLQGVAAAYPGRGANLTALAAEKLLMKLCAKDGDQVGGRVQSDEDLMDLCAVQGGKWHGQMEIG